MTGEQALSREPARGEITTQLLAWSAGDARAAATAFTALYAMLRRLAQRALSGERTDHTLGTAGLISEAFFRMLEQQRIEWRSREHVIATAAQMMRRILVDHARGRSTAKRGHGAPTLPLVPKREKPAPNPSKKPHLRSSPQVAGENQADAPGTGSLAPRAIGQSQRFC